MAGSCLRLGDDGERTRAHSVLLQRTQLADEILHRSGLRDIDRPAADAVAGTQQLGGFMKLVGGPADNGYARPIEGIVAVVDLNRMEVLRIEDHGLRQHSVRLVARKKPRGGE